MRIFGAILILAGIILLVLTKRCVCRDLKKDLTTDRFWVSPAKTITMPAIMIIGYELSAIILGIIFLIMKSQ